MAPSDGTADWIFDRRVVTEKSNDRLGVARIQGFDISGC
jgi:hypothetical protein